MKKYILTAFFLLTISAQDITGAWQGTLEAGANKLRLIVDITKSPTGQCTANMLSIDQASDAIPVATVTLENNTVKLSIPAIGGGYQGTLNPAATELTGHWTQGLPLPLNLTRATPATAWDRNKHATPHTIQFIEVAKYVKLEVLDWGGSGRPLVLLTGLGNNAHVFDKFVTKLTPHYHVYGISRRGFGASSKPETGYTATRLADDVLAVIDALKLTRPILAGHSIAGQELSSIGTRFPNKVAGLIYLDAAYPYAFYDPTRGDIVVDLADLRRKLAQLAPGTSLHSKELVKEIRETTLPNFERALKAHEAQLNTMPEAQLKAMGAPFDGPRAAIMNGVEKHTNMKSPILAIFATSDKNPVAEAQAKALETAIPTAKVVRLPNANHYVFNSNEADVLREMNAFIATLPK